MQDGKVSKVVDQDRPLAFYCFGKYCPRSAYACAKALLWGVQARVLFGAQRLVEAFDPA
jgi:hypothetical protein